MNPFDLPGPEFLALYVNVLIGAVIAAFLLRWALRQPADEPSPEALDLSPYEVAYLSGGEQRAIDAAIVHLIQQGVLGIDAKEGRLSRRSDALPADAHALEKVIFHACDDKSGTLLRQVRQKASTTAAALRPRLEDGGLLVSESGQGPVRWLPGLLILGVGLFGLIKVFVGASRHRPVGFLLILLFVTAVVAVGFFAKRAFRSRRGDRALRRLKEENAALEFATRRQGTDLADADLILALGLFGTGVLAGGSLGHLRTALQTPAAAGAGGAGGGSGCSSWFSCGGSSCGGGGGCGGGCGGGGCGGCGGG